MDKRSLGVRVYRIAESKGIMQTVTHDIITSYIEYCRNLILEGYQVSFFGLVTLVPNVIVDDSLVTQAYICKKVSQKIGISYHTVYAIIAEYLKEVNDDLLDGKSVDIRRVVSLHPLRDMDDNLKTVNASISVSIKRDLNIKNGCVTSVRAHTSRLIKRSISKSST